MKYLVTTSCATALSLLNMVAMAFDEYRRQSRITREATHSVGPRTEWDYLVLWCAALVAVISLIYTIVWIISPGDKSR